jgi:hypothetical protein
MENVHTEKLLFDFTEIPLIFASLLNKSKGMIKIIFKIYYVILSVCEGREDF